jgi:hypothetical protein
MGAIPLPRTAMCIICASAMLFIVLSQHRASVSAALPLNQPNVLIVLS